MQTKVHTVTPDMTLQEVIRFLLDHRVSNVPVVENVDGRKHLLGFLSERDCLAALSDESYFGVPSPQQTAGTLMRRHPVCVAPETDAFSLSSILVSHGFRHLPVTVGEQLLGIVSRRDVMKALDAYYRDRARESNRKHSRPDLTKIVNQRFLISD